MDAPTIEEVKAIDGKIFATLTPRENEVVDFFRAQGRKFGVSVSIVGDANADELARAASRDQADQILRRSNSRVGVIVMA